MSNKVLVLKRNASVDTEGLHNVVQGVLSEASKYDLTLPITNDADNVAMKKIVANLRKEWKAINDEKISFKKAILEPFDEVDLYLKENKVYVDEVISKGSENIKLYEDSKKELIENEVREYFKEVNDIGDFINYEMLGINITLSATMKSYKDTIEQFVTKVKTDLVVIQGMDNKERLRAEYERTLDLGLSINNVNQAIQREQELSQVIEQPKVVVTPREIERQEVKKETLKSFHIKANMSENHVAMIKQLFEKEDIKYKIMEELGGL